MNTESTKDTRPTPIPRHERDMSENNRPSSIAHRQAYRYFKARQDALEQEIGERLIAVTEDLYAQLKQEIGTQNEPVRQQLQLFLYHPEHAPSLERLDALYKTLYALGFDLIFDHDVDSDTTTARIEHVSLVATVR